MRTFSLLTAGVVAAAAVAAPAVAGREDHKNKLGGAETQTFACGQSGDYVLFTGATALWPPNHKYSDYAVEAVDAGTLDDGMVSLTTAITHDEYVTQWIPASSDEEEPEEEVGAGNTQQDARPFFQTDAGADSIRHDAQIRAERSGRGDGRTYTFHVHAEFDSEQCDLEIPVEVPHDMRSDNAPAPKDRTGGDDTEG